MKDGFIKVAAATPRIKVADPEFNTQSIIQAIKEAYALGSKVIVLPELVLSAYTCNDLFLMDSLLQKSKQQLTIVREQTKGIEALVYVGLPWEYLGKIYNVAAVLYKGEVKAFITKKYLPNYAEYYEARYFTPGPDEPWMIPYDGKNVPFGSKILMQNTEMPEMVVGCEICEDLWVPLSPSVNHAMAGATLLVNLSASDETVGKADYRTMLVSMTSAKLLAGYVYCSAGEGESTQDIVFNGHNIISENGTVLSASQGNIAVSEIDLYRIMHERRRMTTFEAGPGDGYQIVPFSMQKEETKISRIFNKAPFVPADEEKRNKNCAEILTIQTNGLKKRLAHTGCKNAVIGISGGLDSTLALLVIIKAFDQLGIDRKNIETITMPCFGTTKRTYNNSHKLMDILGTHRQEIDIKEAVEVHFKDIGHNPEIHDVTYENCQARERTQILMDVANKTNGLVIGTGDMSELALGWATYNGDHMSMYAVNVGVPKTLVRYLVKYYADTCGNQELAAVLYDILDTPVSPELIPPVDGEIAQKTEEIVGDYLLHDFFLYYLVRCGFSPEKIKRIAILAFDGIYDEETISKWLKVFIKRFFAQQFKRSCIPDGPKVGSVALSPRGDLRMPSDACANAWITKE